MVFMVQLSLNYEQAIILRDMVRDEVRKLDALWEPIDREYNHVYYESLLELLAMLKKETSNG